MLLSVERGQSPKDEISDFRRAPRTPSGGLVTHRTVASRGSS